MSAGPKSLDDAKKCLIGIAILLLVLEPPPVFSQRAYVAIIAEENTLVVRERPGTASVEEEGDSLSLQDELHEALSRGVDTLLFEVETYEFRDTLNINRSLTISSGLPDSARVDLRCNGIDQLFSIENEGQEAVRVVFENLRIRNCSTSHVQGIVHIGKDTSVLFDHVEFIDNVASDEESAIVVVDSDVELEIRGNSSFSNNRGRAFLLGNQTVVSIENSSFANNTANGRGAVFASKLSEGGIQLNMRGSTFMGNVVQEGSGGALWLEGSSVTFRDRVIFVRNKADDQGGAIVLREYVAIQISGTTFEDNSCQLGRGGALLLSPSGEARCRIQRSIFVKNSANGAMGFGGAIAIRNTTVDAAPLLNLAPDVLFLKNTARISGGAVAVNGTSNTISASATFVANTVQGDGGGLGIIPAAGEHGNDAFIDVTVQGANFVQNAAERRHGGAISVKGRAKLTTRDSHYIENRGRHGGALHLDDVGQPTIIETCTISRNIANEGGGSVMINSGNNVSITHCTFTEDRADSGGSIYLRHPPEVDVESSSFYGCSARRGGGAISISNSRSDRGQDSKIELYNCTFVRNKSKTPEDNDGFGGAVQISGAGADTRIANCIFQDNEARWGGSINLDEAFSTTINKSRFLDNSATLGGAIYIVPLEREVAGNYDFTALTDCNMSQNVADKGGAIFARPDRPLSEEIIDRSNSSLTFTDSSFLQNRARNVGGGVFLSGMNTEFSNCSFRHNSAKYEVGDTRYFSNARYHSGGGIYASDGSHVTLTETMFEANEADRYGGGACIIDALFNCTEDCLFTSNMARDGGGVYCSMSSRKLDARHSALLHCEGCLFVRNKAERGGGLYASIPDFEEVAQQIEECQKEGNCTGRCEESDRCQYFVLVSNRPMTTNTANITGNAIFSTRPSAIFVSSENQTSSLIDYVNTTQQDNSNAYDVSSTLREVVLENNSLIDLNRADTAEELGKLQFQVLDHFGRVAEGSRVLAEIRACQSATECCGSNSKLLHNGEIIFFGETSRISDQGNISFHGLQISDNKTGISKASLSVCFEDDGEEPVDIAPIQINVSFRGCYVMERRRLETGRCLECDPGQYLVGKDNSCTTCPERAECKNLTITPHARYWHPTSVSNQISSCHPRQACDSDREELMTNATSAHRQQRILNWTDPEYDQCSKGYESILCRSCTEDHGHWNHLCIECYDTVLIWLSLLASVLWNLLILLIFIYSARTLVDRLHFNQQVAPPRQQTRRRGTWRREREEIQLVPQIPDGTSSNGCSSELPLSHSRNTATESPTWLAPSRSILRWRRLEERQPTQQLPLANPLSESLKIMINFVQVIYLAALLSEDLPSIFRWTLIPLDSVNFTETAFLLADCLLRGQQDRTILRMSLQALFPLFMFLLVCFIPVLVRPLWRAFKIRSFGVKEVRLIALCTVYLYFGPEVRTLLNFLDDVTLKEETVEDSALDLKTSHYWSIDTSVEFMKGPHAYVVALLICPLLIALIIGYPLVLFISLNKEKDRMQEEEVLSSYGFLYKGYEEKYYYWEIVIIIRKTLLGIISVFVENAELQSAYISITLVFFLSLQLLLSPFTSKFPYLNGLEALSLGVSILVFSGVTLMLRSNDLDKHLMRSIIAWVLFLVLLTTFIVMGQGIYRGALGFLDDKLIENQIYPDKASLESVPINKKIYGLMEFYLNRFRSLVTTNSTRRAPENELPRV